MSSSERRARGRENRHAGSAAEGHLLFSVDRVRDALMASGACAYLACSPTHTPFRIEVQHACWIEAQVPGRRWGFWQNLWFRQPQARRGIKQEVPHGCAVAVAAEHQHMQQQEKLLSTASISWLLNFFPVARVSQWLLRRLTFVRGKGNPTSLGTILANHGNDRSHAKIYFDDISADMQPKESKLYRRAFPANGQQRLNLQNTVASIPLSTGPFSALETLPLVDALAGAVLTTALMQQVLHTAASWQPVQFFSNTLDGTTEAAHQLVHSPSSTTAHQPRADRAKRVASEQADREPTAVQVKEGSSSCGLVIRIFGRWPSPAEWVNIVNIPLSGGLGEKTLRGVMVAEERTPLIAPLFRSMLTGLVTSQVFRAISESEWGELTMSLWTRGNDVAGSPQRPFEIGYEVVEVPATGREEIIAAARLLPVGGTPGRVVQVPQVQAAAMLWFNNERLERQTVADCRLLEGSLNGSQRTTSGWCPRRSIRASNH